MPTPKDPHPDQAHMNRLTHEEAALELQKLTQWAVANKLSVSFMGTPLIGSGHVEMVVHNDTLDAYYKLPGMTRKQIQGNWDE